MEKTHWKKNFDYRFLSGDEIPGEITVEIERVTKEETFNPSSNSKEDVLAVYFKGAKKGIILNKTNAKAIAKVAGTPYQEDWIGTKIIIYPKDGKFFGEQMKVVRVKIQKVQ